MGCAEAVGQFQPLVEQVHRGGTGKAGAFQFGNAQQANKSVAADQRVVAKVRTGGALVGPDAFYWLDNRVLQRQGIRNWNEHRFARSGVGRVGFFDHHNDEPFTSLARLGVSGGGLCH